MEKNSTVDKKQIFEELPQIIDSFSEDEALKMIEILNTKISSTKKLEKDLINNLLLGEYVKYESDTKYQGLWRVLYNGDYDLNDGHIEIISDECVDFIQLGDKDPDMAEKSYDVAIETLDIHANAYLNKKYACKARCVNFSGNDIKVLRLVNSLDIGKTYWLASKYIHKSYNIESYCLRIVDHNISYDALLYKKSHGGNINSRVLNFGLRPVITLKKSVKIIGGNGTKNNPYILG